MLDDLEEKILNAELIENDRRTLVNIVYNLQELSDKMLKFVEIRKQRRIREFVHATTRVIIVICDPDPNDFDICELYYNLDTHTHNIIFGIFALSREWKDYSDLRYFRRNLMGHWCSLRKRYPVKELKIGAKEAWENYLNTINSNEYIMIE